MKYVLFSICVLFFNTLLFADDKTISESSSADPCEYDYCGESSSSTESSGSEEKMSFSFESNLIACYTPDENGGCKFSRYVSKVRPPMHGEPSLNDNGLVFCEYIDNEIYVGFFANIATTKYVEEPSDFWNLCYYDENNCGNGTGYTAHSLEQPFYECSMSSLDENGCMEMGGVSVYVDGNLQIADRTNKWLPSNVTRDQIIAMGDEAIGRTSSMVVYYNDQKIGHGLLSNLSSRTLAGALDFCDYIINDYEWKNRSSSSEQMESSSSIAEFSSSAIESSSSEEYSSSTVELSSSSEFNSSSSFFEENSSSSASAAIFVPDGNQTYTSEQIFRDGLQNMEDGKCYSLNPERGTITGWNISYNAQDTWWWREVDCETGEIPVEEGVGACAAYPGSKPTDVSDCYSYNGSCFACDDSRDYVDCNADWLWNYNFPTHDWFKQVDCDNPFEEEDYVCPEVSSLQKNTSNEAFANDYEAKEKQNPIAKFYYFDALGRSMNKKSAFSAKRPVYIKQEEYADSKERNTEESGHFKVLLKTVSGSVEAYTSGSFEYAIPEGSCILVVTLELTTLDKDIKITLEGDEEAIKQHELKHAAIYKEYGNKTWTVQTTVSRPFNHKKICKRVQGTYWSSIESEYRYMLKLQNDWDDEDKNNVNHDRINVNSAVSDLKKLWFDYNCDQE